MNFKLNKIALALPIAVSAMAAGAIQMPDDAKQVTGTLAQQKAKQSAAQELIANRYIILMQDEPVALYQGGVKGLAATNVQASNHTNVTQSGKLDLQSNASVAYGHYLAAQQASTLTQINNKVGREITVTDTHTVAINGFVAELEEHEVNAIRKLPGVLAVEKEQVHQLLTDVGPEHVGAPIIWDETTNYTGSKGEGLVVGVMDTGIASYTQRVYSWTGVGGFDNIDFHPSFADVGADGYDHSNPYGEGVYFGDCQDEPHWCNDKLVGVVGYEGIRPLSISSSDMRWDRAQDPHGHGTHVASTIAGNVVNDVQFRTGIMGKYRYDYYDADMTTTVSGVAPHANIISYQTCNWSGCFPSAAITSIEHAIENDVDVLNYSVGGGASSPWFTADALAFLSAREAGIHVAVAAGNSGRNGPKTVGSPGNSPWVTTVAALTHGRDYTEKTATFSGGASSLEDMVGLGATSGVSGELVYAGDVESENYIESAGGPGYCSKYSLPAYYSDDSIEGKVIVCRRGGMDTYGDPLPRLAKGAEALRTRAAGMILINESDDFDNVVSDMHVLPTIHVNKEQGEALLAWMAEGEGHSVDFGAAEFEKNDDMADVTAAFTSRGPDYFTGDYLIPDIGAPGSDIYAGGIGSGMHSYRLENWEKLEGDYRFMSGTSMATPHIAGMYLLMKAVRPDWTPAEAQSALMMTAVTDVKQDDDFDGEMVRADMHRTGAGSARVNLAVEAGLVMNETREGYLAANPYAEDFNMVDEIEGWHGQPHQLNLPSLSKGECLIECSWTRTFTAKKAGSWTVSFDHLDEGYELTADVMEFTVEEGDDVVINFTAEANQALAQDWVNGRVVLTPSDASIPSATLPVTINFIAGVVPDIVEVKAKRNADSSAVEGIMTIGTDDLQLSKSGIAQADVHEMELMRDPTNGNWIDNETSIAAFPLNIEDRTQRVVIDVMGTTSPDIDIFVGIDSDLDGFPGVREIGLVRYASSSPTSDELIDIIDPIPGTYWVMVHNWAEGPDELAEDEMVCEGDEQPAEGMVCVTAEDVPVFDPVKVSITNVNFDDESMIIDVPTSVEPREQVTTRLKWHADMSEDDIFHGVFRLGTTADLPTNVGTIRVNMTRGEDDVVIEQQTSDTNSDMIGFNIAIASNETPEAREYSFSVDLADGVVVESLTSTAQAEGMAMMMSSTMTDVDYTVSGNTVSWTHVQAIGSAAASIELVVNTSEVDGMQDVTPVISSMVNTSDVAEVTAPAEPVFVEGRPVFTASTTTPMVKEGETITLSASVVESVIADAQISYQWRQVSGPTASITANAATMSFIAPDVSEDTTLTFEMTGSNGSKNAAPVTVAVDVENKGSSGSMGLGMLFLSALALVRRKVKQG